MSASLGERARSWARTGVGPLLQRDYWAFVDRPEVGAHGVTDVLRARFCEIAPPDLVRFRRLKGEGTLELGDELEVRIRFAGHYYVRVIHLDANSITLGTLDGHPECGRITFGAYRHASGKLIVHIRSRARSSGLPMRTGFVAVGDPMQVQTWSGFIERLAAVVGRGVLDFVYEETSEHDDEPNEDCPTFVAEGD